MKLAKISKRKSSWTLYATVFASILCACNAPAIDNKKVGLGYAANQMYDSAQWHLKQHLEGNPKDFEARYELGSALEYLGRLGEAKDELGRIVNDKDANCSIRRRSAMSCGRILEYQPQLDSAAHYYYRAFHLNEICPEDKEEASFIYLLITQTHQKAGNIVDALIAVDSAILLGTPLRVAATIKGGLLAEHNRFAAADSIFMIGLEATDGDSSGKQSLYAAMARAALKQGNENQACSLYHVAKEWGYPASITDLDAACE